MYRFFFLALCIMGSLKAMEQKQLQLQSIDKSSIIQTTQTSVRINAQTAIADSANNPIVIDQKKNNLPLRWHTHIVRASEPHHKDLSYKGNDESAALVCEYTALDGEKGYLQLPLYGTYFGVEPAFKETFKEGNLSLNAAAKNGDEALIYAMRKGCYFQINKRFAYQLTENKHLLSVMLTKNQKNKKRIFNKYFGTGTK